MALLGSDSEIGANSLEMLSIEEQEFDDYCAGEILISGIKARADYQCTTASPESFASLGPSVQAEASNAAIQTRQNIASQSSMTLDLVNSYSAPVIQDDQIAGAPNAQPVGSAGATSPFTQRQLDAAQNQPINWPATLTIQSAVIRAQRFKKVQAYSRQRRQTSPQTVGQIDRLMPGTGWGNASAARQGWCGGLESKPWGKLLLFTGLGLIGASLLQRK